MQAVLYTAISLGHCDCKGSPILNIVSETGLSSSLGNKPERESVNRYFPPDPQLPSHLTLLRPFCNMSTRGLLT